MYLYENVIFWLCQRCPDVFFSLCLVSLRHSFSITVGSCTSQVLSSCFSSPFLPQYHHLSFPHCLPTVVVLFSFTCYQFILELVCGICFIVTKCCLFCKCVFRSPSPCYSVHGTYYPQEIRDFSVVS